MAKRELERVDSMGGGTGAVLIERLLDEKANPTAKERYQFDPAVWRAQLHQKHRQGHGIRV